MIDLNGVVRNEWPHPGVPARIIDPALNDGRVGDIGLQLSQLADSPGGIYGPTLTRMIYRSQAVPYDWVPANTPRSLDPVDLRVSSKQ